jgi:hypothetical protein
VQELCRKRGAFPEERLGKTLAQAAAVVEISGRENRNGAFVKPDILTGTSAWQQAGGGA